MGGKKKKGKFMWINKDALTNPNTVGWQNILWRKLCKNNSDLAPWVTNKKKDRKKEKLRKKKKKRETETVRV